MTDTAPPARGPSLLRERAVFFAEAFLRGYAQILFSRSPLVGLLLLAATAIAPRLLVGGAAAVLLALGAARLIGLHPEQIRSGLYGYNALLVGLGGAALFEASLSAVALVAVAVIASVFVTATLHSALGSAGLPALTLPFLFVFTLELAAAPALGIAFTPLAADPSALALRLPEILVRLLHSLGALFFVPRADAGALILLALLVSSRIGALLAVLGFGVAELVGLSLVAAPGSLLPAVLGYNAMLAAYALGGIWFVPGPSAFLLGLAAALFSTLVAAGLAPLFAWNGVPLAILPFNVTVILLLYAMRQRLRDGRPKAVDFLIGTPEENLSYYRTRVARFGAHYLLRFRAPFLGRWVCTQGTDGAESHQGPWRFGADFEVLGADGRTHRGAGAALTDYHCYRLPVLAAADGVVAKVVDGVPNSAIGEVDLEHNWGNAVVLYHAPGIYSLVAHLAPGTIKVSEGQPVRQGDALALCGSSGRSPVPHLHFQLQGTARLGSPTLFLELHDVIVARDGARELRAAHVPAKGELLGNPEPQEDLRALFAFPYGKPVGYVVDGGAAGEGAAPSRREELVADLDVYGTLLLRGRGAVLSYDLQADHFTVYDTLGHSESALHLVQAALCRVPFELAEGLSWIDHLPQRRLLPAWLRWLVDLAAPFLPGAGIELRYTARREGRSLVVSGASARRQRDGTPLVQTEAVLVSGRGLESVSLTVRGRTRTMRRLDGAAVQTPSASQPRTDEVTR